MNILIYCFKTPDQKEIDFVMNFPDNFIQGIALYQGGKAIQVENIYML